MIIWGYRLPSWFWIKRLQNKKQKQEIVQVDKQPRVPKIKM